MKYELMWSAIRRILVAIRRLLTHVALYSILGALLFSPYCIVGWILSGDVTGVFVLTFCGMLIGALLGVGDLVVETFSDREFTEHAEDPGKLIIQLYAGAMMPALRVLYMFHWLTTKDFSRQRPHRWKRALAGGFFAGVIGCAIAVFAETTSPNGPGAMELWEFTAAIGMVFGSIGAIAGGLSDAW